MIRESNKTKLILTPVGQLTGVQRTDEPTHRQPYFFISPFSVICACVSISNKTSLRDFEIEYVTERTNR